MTALVDLHTHSTYSDGVLAPRELVARAAARGVGTLALTDHDTMAGLAEAREACAANGIEFVAGVELSASWRGQAIHVIALGIAETALAALLADIGARRRARVVGIGERLTKRGRLPGDAITAAALAEVGAAGTPTRTHVARALVAAGHARDTQQAFDRWLARDRPGHVPVEWPALSEVVAAAKLESLAVVLAHPHRYRLSGGALRQLVAEFASAGGHALELSLPGMSLGDRDRIATLARRHGLKGSAGSDFHDPATPWTPLGRIPVMPDGIESVVNQLRVAPAQPLG